MQAAGREVCQPQNNLNAVSFTDANVGTTVGKGGTILRTTDGGDTWVSQSSGKANWLTSVFFTDANTGTAVGSGGTILRTIDGGGL
ncbi:MAG: WD40/YVTN/BNR-like repeat-containing protein [Candidatus Zixiibacteriota bacterium]